MLAIEDWGIIDYHEAWERQKQLQTAVQQRHSESTLVLCQHPTVITIGRNGGEHHVLPSARERAIPVVPINRGGDVTLHNPGQLVGYPIVRLTDFREDLHWFLREIEQCIIESIAEFGIQSERVQGLTGVWVSGKRKICAIGIHCSRWVTAHGFALNVCNAIDDFSTIVPCGIADRAVTSIAMESTTPPTFADVQNTCARVFAKKFA